MNDISQEQLKQRQLAPIKSGAYAFLNSGLIPCQQCLFGKPMGEEGLCECSQVKIFQEERVEEIKQLPQIKGQDLPLIISLVREETLQMIIANFLGRKGILAGGKSLEYQPILKLWYLSINAANRMRDALGLSPQSRAKLGVATAIGFDFARRMQELDKEDTEDASE